MKEMTTVAKTVMTDEEMADVEKQINAGHSNGTPQSVSSTPHVDPEAEPTNRLSRSSEKSPVNGAESTSPTQDQRKRPKLTPEQKKKLEEIEMQRKKAMEERIDTLTKQLIERLRPYVDAKNPGDRDDPETVAFQDKIKQEAEDMKLESFGIEVCLPFTRYRSSLTNTRSQLLHAIGSVYVTKATSFLKSKKFLGM